MSTLAPSEKLLESLSQKKADLRSPLEQLLLDHGDSDEKFLAAILEQKLVSEDELYPLWAKSLGVAFLKLERGMIETDAIKKLSKDFCKQHHLLPISVVGQELTIAIANPLALDAIAAVERQTEMVVLPVMASPNRIETFTEQVYLDTGGLEEALKKIDLKALDEETLADPQRLARVAGNDAVVSIVDFLLTETIKEGASDIHIEPRPDGLQVRLRIDGVLHEVHKFPAALTPPVISRMKILADLDIAERRKPLDGRIKFKVGQREVEFRVSTLPTVFGEKVVARLLDQSKVILNLDQMGFSATILHQIRELIQAPHGIILVTGPTGSGKTTTLYGMLAEVNSPDYNIVTVEDPVEYSLPLVNQVQVNVKAGRTFSTALRAILRQDPDIVMIGEIRDSETAGIAVQAALTGHLVLSTLHTNSAIQAIPRLIDIGVEPYLLAPALRGVMAQRLVRRLCPECQVEDKPPESQLKAMGFAANDPRMKFFKGKGCSNCKNSGYSGRTGIHELLVVNDPIRDLISRRAPETEIRSEAAKAGFRTLSYDGIKKSLLGTTDIEEVARVCLE